MNVTGLGLRVYVIRDEDHQETAVVERSMPKALARWKKYIDDETDADEDYEPCECELVPSEKILFPSDMVEGFQANLLGQIVSDLLDCDLKSDSGVDQARAAQLCVQSIKDRLIEGGLMRKNDADQE